MDHMIYLWIKAQVLCNNIILYLLSLLNDLLKEVEVIITVTGRYDVLTYEHVQYIKDGTFIANAGHYNMEINLKSFEENCDYVESLKDDIKQYCFKDKKIKVIGNGNPINLTVGAGNPIEIMELGYALQLLSLEEIVHNNNLAKCIQDLPEDINQKAAKLLLDL